MKNLSALALCAALVCSAAHAAPPVKPVQTKPTASANAAATPAVLVGLWNSVNAEGNILPGSIELKADGHASLSPKGETHLEGTWRTEGKMLFLVMPPHGTAQMTYAISAKGLTLTYENGAKQQFKHSTTKK